MPLFFLTSTLLSTLRGSVISLKHHMRYQYFLEVIQLIGAELGLKAQQSGSRAHALNQDLVLPGQVSFI